MRTIFLCVALAVALALKDAVDALPQQPENPIIGMFTDPWSDCEYNPPKKTDVQCVESFYVRWLAAAGVRSVPIPWNTTKEHRTKLLKSVNGILFPGGGIQPGPLLNAYFAVVRDIVNQAQEWNAQGDPFVVWGTCMGFQMVCAAVADDLKVIHSGFKGMYPSMLPLYFTKEQPTSRMFGNATTPASILSILQNQNSTLNWHNAGVTPDSYAKHTALQKGLNVLSTNVDITGREFISSVEGTNGTAIYATQFHPERPQFEYTSDKIGHTVGDLKVSEYLALWLASKLKLNNHSFASPEEAERHSIHNYPIHNYGLGFELYWLPYLHPDDHHH